MYPSIRDDGDPRHGCYYLDIAAALGRAPLPDWRVAGAAGRALTLAWLCIPYAAIDSEAVRAVTRSHV